MRFRVVKRRFYPITKILPREYEEWLEKYESKGWHLESYNGFLHYLVKGKPRKFKYCYDYQVKMKQDYEAIFLDSGWEFINHIGAAYLWRIEYEGEKPEAFSDVESALVRNKKFLTLLGLCNLPSLVVFALGVKQHFKWNPNGYFVLYTSFDIVDFMPVIFILTMIFLIGKLISEHIRLKRKLKK